MHNAEAGVKPGYRVTDPALQQQLVVGPFAGAVEADRALYEDPGTDKRFGYFTEFTASPESRRGQ